MPQPFGRAGRGNGGGGGNRRVCFQFRDTGMCRFGASCQYAHIGTGGGGGGGGTGGRGGRGGRNGGRGRSGRNSNSGGRGGRGFNRQPQHNQRQQQNQDHSTRNTVERFVQHLSVLSGNKLSNELTTKSELWLTCWQRHSLLSKGTRMLLVQVLSRLSESANAPPPSLPDHIVPVVVKFMQEQTGSGDPNVLLTHITTVRSVVKRCLKFEWPHGSSRSQIKTGLEAMISAAQSKILINSKDHRPVLSELLEVSDYLEKPWSIRIQELAIVSTQGQNAGSDNGSQVDDVDESIIWKICPTVGWLKDGKYFTPSSCPIMDRGVYESSAEYMGTVFKLWTAMTFFDAHTACAPTCRARGSGASATCGKVLWPVGTGSDGARNNAASHLTCRRPNCTRPVDFCCSVNKSHDALCSSCASRIVVQRLGPPGPAACTHIYDATIDAVHADGYLELKDFKSRRPPDKPIHWRSTKRLASPNLVGIIKLSSRGAALQDDDAIQWGEVTPFGYDFRQEGRFREQGKVKVNIASIVEWGGASVQSGNGINGTHLHDVEDVYPVESRVVIIDCMTFTPEWIPTLRALESMSRTRLPFEDGRHLNLCRESPVVPASLDMTGAGTPTNDELVERMLEVSQLEPIREVRRSEYRSTLGSQLVNLMDETTLDPMQCQAFLSSLCSPVHLTQGPPGTGKSYTGVVLVRALIIIRELWLKVTKNAGPILVLSYKNHAIDEFLVDLVSSPSFRGGFGSSNPRLIRIGGKCQDSRLQAYSERTAYEKDTQVTKARVTLQSLQDLKKSIQATLTGNAAFFLHYQHLIFGASDEQQQDKARRQAAYEATDLLMECIVQRNLLEKALVTLDPGGANVDESILPGNNPSCDEVAKVLSILQLTEIQSSSGSTTRAASRIIKQQVSQRQSGTIYTGQLSSGMEHYNLEHWGDVLEKWITGVRPRPLCKFDDCGDGESCTELAMTPDPPLCDRHRCKLEFTNGGEDNDNSVQRCSSPCLNGNVHYCRDHLCKEEDCRSCRRAAVGEEYCSSHACRKCVAIGTVPAGFALDEPPRNTCSSHPMCVISSCVQFCQEVGSSMYCPDHETVQCVATTKRGNPCKGKAVDRSFPYCKNHLHLVSSASLQGPEPEVVTADGKSSLMDLNKNRTCHTTNKKGKPCKGAALPGRRYCYDHSALESDQTVMGAEDAPMGAWCQVISAKQSNYNPSSSKNNSPMMIESLTKTQMSPSEDAQLIASQEVTPILPSKVHDDDDRSASSESFFSVPSEPDCKPPALEADEIDWEDDNEENAHAMHLREVFEVEEESDSDSNSETSCSDADFVNSDEQGVGSQEVTHAQQTIWGDPNQWNWEMPLSERWSACSFFLETLLQDLRKASCIAKSATSLARKELQQAKVNAKARAYENKTVIGGTMVGCISRLESIRASRPFAIVIEEASEVLEPLLFSCLSESTMKLELVGDHRQLSPSLNDRFDFERRNKVNVSMFQRLIEAPDGHSIPSTVLSIQRRMRRNIADLTRSFYTDVTHIEDHESCATQVLGRKLPPGSRILTNGSSTGGREIPGIGPHVFLWTHGGAQQRSEVGVSRINKQEASMACGLAAYLVECGVAKRSIAILTPYKGQLMLIRKMLLSNPAFTPMKLISKNQSETDVIRVSTVDRFQGDEEDVVICSLVVDEKSRTGFVKLVNRMIVLLSRARLGSYILGNVAYFKSNMPEHWAKTFEMLQAPAETDSDVVSPTDVYTGPRTGAAIPLCCPLHRSIIHEVSTPEQLKTGFCTELCHQPLVCGHECSLKCHWPGKQHNPKCTQKIESPCDRHTGKLECHFVFANSVGAPFGTTHESIAKYYRCPRKVELQLPCGHSETYPCWEEAQIVSGARSWPRCQKPSPTPYTFPSCGHSRPVTCCELVDFRTNPASVQCDRTEEYIPPCGHVIAMKCFKKEKYEKGDNVFTCSVTEQTKLPRCGHTHKLRCGIARQIASWTGKQCEEIGKVKEGVTYGAQDHTCNKLVTVSRLCGHDIRLPCNEAFARTTSMNACRVMVDAKNNCGHACKLACNDFRALGSASLPSANNTFKEGQIPQRSTVIPNAPRCDEWVRLERRCGHVERIKCCLVDKPIAACEVGMSVKSPLCGHDLVSPCRVSLPTNLWPSETFESISHGAVLSKEKISDLNLSSVGNEAEGILRTCPHSIDVELECGHIKGIKCSMLLNALRPGRYEKVKCEKEVALELSCGHTTTVKCFQRRHYLDGTTTINCAETVGKDCWNHPICGKSLQVKCGFEGAVGCKEKSTWTCPTGAHQYELCYCATGSPLDCPGCTMDKLDMAISGPLDFDCVQQLQQVFRNFHGVQWLHTNDKTLSYVNLESQMLSRYQAWLESEADVWTRPVLKHQRIACFVILDGKKQQALQSFDRSLINPNFLGIDVIPLTAENLRQLTAKSSTLTSLTLLAGTASVARTKVLVDESIPKNRKGKRKLMAEAQKEFFDSLLFVDKKGYTRLIVWEPFPVVELCKVRLSHDDLQALLLNFSGAASLPDLRPAGIAYDAPPSGLTLSVPFPDEMDTSSVVDDEYGDDDGDEEEEAAHAIRSHLAGTILSGFHVDLNWPGGVASNGTVTPRLEADLLQKMSFANREAAPFAAIKLLRTLLENGNSARVLHLCEAAEKAGLDNDKALESLDTYLRKSKGDGMLIHPWALIVAARLEPSSATELLSTYSIYFPQQERYLTKEEIDACHAMSDDDGEDDDASNGGDKLQQEWDRLVEDHPYETESDATVELLAMIGLRKVKMEVLRLWKYAFQLRVLDDEARAKNAMTLNYVYEGNPGTGKTSVARLFARILYDCGLRSNNVFVETNAQEAKDGGTDDFRKKVQSAMGGVLFIDEAYDLDPVGDFKGKPIVNEILSLCENERDKISVVLAGYEDDFTQKFFAYNNGLKSRFNELMFDDFEQPELEQIWTSMRKDRLWDESDKVSSVASKRMAKMAGKKGFGNAREVRKRLEAATSTAMVRLGDSFSANTMRLEVEDVIGQDPRLESEKLRRVVGELESKIGWSRVKTTVRQLMDLCSTNYKRELLGKRPFDLVLNRLFLGNPGTGKTSCAKIYGRLLKELGFLSNGDVVCKVASDFVGSVVGESQKKTEQLIEGARGKVLIIDEAYALDDNLYGAQVLDTLVERVQGSPGDDIAVLLLGYEDDMQKMLKNQNPGLLRRFSPDYAFFFDDFSDSELLAILDGNLKFYQTKASIEFKEKALEVLQNQRRQTNFGNAGAVDLLLKGAVQKAAKRLEGGGGGGAPGEVVLDADDIHDSGESQASKLKNPLAELDRLYKMENIKEKLDGMRKRLEVARREGDDEIVSLHFVFRGSPGTGKTTVARVLANILFGLKLKPSPKIVETAGLELMADFVGQTSTKVTDMLKDAKGGILFIDEAYNLGDGNGSFGKEALDTLLAAMTDPAYEDVSIVIAGYPDELNQMLSKNPGMKSRFTDYIDFEDWEEHDCASFFQLCSSQNNFELDDGVIEAVRDGCSTIRSLNGWANGRDVKKLWTDAKGLRSNRVYDTPNVEKTLALTDVQGAIQVMIEARIPGASFAPQSGDPLSELDELYKMENVKDKLDAMRKNMAVAQREGSTSKVSAHFVFRGAPGTGKTTVARTIAQVLFSLKLKPSPKIVETTGLDLMADYAGQTSTKVTEKLKESKGGVLFIDEAYNLGGGSFGKEALDTLLAAMTSPNYEDVCIVIAGYPVELDQMMSSNPGLKSRFTDYIEFEDWDGDDCVSFVRYLSQKNQFELQNGVDDIIRTGCQKLVKLPGWANGRDVAKLWTDMQRFRAERVYDDTETVAASKTITLADTGQAVNSMLNARTVPDRKPGPEHIPPIAALVDTNSVQQKRLWSPMEQPQKQQAPMTLQKRHAPPTSTTQQESRPAPQVNTSTERTVAEVQKEHEETDGGYDSGTSGDSNKREDRNFVDGRDDGVTDEEWEELELAKEREKLLMEELRRQQEESDRLLEEAKKAEEEARRKHQEELERIQKELERDEQERARRLAWEKEERRRLAAEEERKRLEAERQRIQEEERKKQEVQRRLQQIRPCPMGFNWHHCGGGWRCGGGSHFVSDAVLRQQFGVDI